MPLPIPEIGRVVHESLRAYCITQNDLSQVSWDEAPTWQRDACLAGVRSVIKNAHLPMEEAVRQSHDAWRRHKLEEGWAYGEEKDPEAKTHPCLVAHDQLPDQQRYKDWLFVQIVRVLAFHLPR